MKKKSIVLILLLAAAVLVTGVSAAGVSGRSDAGLPVRSSPVRSSPTPVQEQRAKILNERIETVIARFNNNKDRHVASYNAIKDEVAKVVQTMSAKGYDTGKLQADFQTWNDMIVKAAGDYATFISILQSSEQFTPYGSEGQFLSTIDQARKQLRAFRQDELDIRNFYQTVLRPDVQSLAEHPPEHPAELDSMKGGVT